MKSKTLFEKHIEFQKGCYLNNTKNIDDIFYVKSKYIKDIDWNYIYSENTESLINIIEKKLNIIMYFSKINNKKY
jgi:hypothetical protein